MSTAHDHDRWADSLGAWLLGALPEDEAEGFRAHLAACAVCRADAESLRVAVDALPASAPPALPPPALKGRVMAIVEREASLLEAAGPEADRAAPQRRRRRFPQLAGLTLRPALATALVLLLLVVGGGAALLGREALDQDARVVAARVDPALGGARASLEVDGDRARLVGRRLPAPPAGRVYQVWLDRGGAAPEPTSALFSTRRDGSASVDVPGSLEGVRAVMVTDEPAGGSAKPTGRIIITASPA
jgi:Anti-sigma-K factor rskA/Putative zinc-finger